MLQWDALDEGEKAKHPFQRDLKRRMDGIIADCMKKIERNKERLAAADTPLITPADQVWMRKRTTCMGPPRHATRPQHHGSAAINDDRLSDGWNHCSKRCQLRCRHGLAARGCACRHSPMHIGRR